jgi:DNA-binding transcriptional ArsR family regulator
VSTKEFGVVEENGARKGGTEDVGVERLVAMGRALADPIRVRMLSMMAEGRSCCDFSNSGVPVEEGEEGICVCEFEEAFSMGQSKVSYHMRKLKDAGLVTEERHRAAWRGRRPPALGPPRAERGGWLLLRRGTGPGSCSCAPTIPPGARWPRAS